MNDALNTFRCRLETKLLYNYIMKKVKRVLSVIVARLGKNQRKELRVLIEITHVVCKYLLLLTLWRRNYFFNFSTSCI